MNENSKLLTNANKENFHSEVARLLYVARQVRFDILTAVAFLTTAVQSPTEQDQGKLDHIYKYCLQLYF